MTINNLEQKFVVCGHRGYAGKYPENTLTGFVAACELGVDMIEVDVVETKDHVPIISHDYGLKRTTGMDGMFADYTLKELRKLNIAATSNKAIHPEQICTFEEICELLTRYPSVMINIDMKNDEGSISNKVADIVEKYRFKERVVFNGLGGNGLAQMSDRGYYVEASPDGYYNMAHFSSLFGPGIQKAKALCYNANQHVTKENVEKLKAQYNVNVWAWCSNWDGYSTDDNGKLIQVSCDTCLQNMLDCGITMALCNHPDICINLLKKKGLR